MTPHEIAELQGLIETRLTTPVAHLQGCQSDWCACGAKLDRDLLTRTANALRTLEAEKTTAEKSLAYWKTCANCGQPMDAPGLCSVAQHEWQKGQEQMLDETLTRAEKAESALAAAQQQIADLTTWRLVSEAPNDGEAILGMSPHWSMPSVCRLRRGKFEPEAATTAMQLQGYCSYHQPTRWLPLPPAPATDAPRSTP